MSYQNEYKELDERRSNRQNKPEENPNITGDVPRRIIHQQMGIQNGIVLIGPSQAGKSTLGNALIQLGDKIKGSAFKTGGFNVSVTKEIESSSVFYDGNILNIIDTPGLEDTNVPDSYIFQQLIELIMSSTVITNLIFVLNRQFKINDQLIKTVEVYMSLFSDNTTYFTIVVSGITDDVIQELKEKNMTVNTYCDHLSNKLKPIFNVSLPVFPVNSRPRNENDQLWLKKVMESLIKNKNTPITKEEYVRIPGFLVHDHEVLINKLNAASIKINNVLRTFKNTEDIIIRKSGKSLSCCFSFITVNDERLELDDTGRYTIKIYDDDQKALLKEVRDFYVSKVDIIKKLLFVVSRKSVKIKTLNIMMNLLLISDISSVDFKLYLEILN
jgi:GTPase SAR1 family protein